MTIGGPALITLSVVALALDAPQRTAINRSSGYGLGAIARGTARLGMARGQKSKKLPPLVYKFYGPARRDVFKNFKVRFSQVAALNDPFEFLIDATSDDLRQGLSNMAARTTNPFNLAWMAISGSLAAVGRNEQIAAAPRRAKVAFSIIFVPFCLVAMLLMWPFISKQLSKFLLIMADEFGDIFNKARDGLFVIFSCSEIWNCVPMWAHYASNHTGFTIGLDPRTAFPSPRTSSDTPYYVPRRVKYRTQAPRLNKITLNLGDFLAMKMPHWSYEREWRFIALADDAAARGNFAEGYELLFYDLNKESIKEVIFGLNCGIEVVADVLEMLAVADIHPALYQVQKQRPGYGFSRAQISQLSDLKIEPPAPGRAAGLENRSIDRAYEAFLEFQRDAQNHPIASKLLVSTKTKPE